MKSIYHNRNFVIARIVIYTAVLIILAVMLHKRASQKESSPGTEFPDGMGLQSDATESTSAPSPLAEALLANLEALADKQLPSPALDGIAELTVAVPQPENTAEQLTTLTQELGGTILPDAISLDKSDFSKRIILSIPPEKLPEFTRRAQLLTGTPLVPPIGASVFAITLEKATSVNRP